MPRISHAALVLALSLAPHAVHAQWRVGRDSITRWQRFDRDISYGVAEGLGYTLADQLQKDPKEWGAGWPGFEKRAGSNLGEFVIQQAVTSGLAAAMRRPFGYKLCKCDGGTGKRALWAVRAAVTDQMPDGSHPIAIPRIVGAYTGSYAQSTWRPSPNGHWRDALWRGTTSLAVGALVNLYYEFR